jgi:hypothetical protein
VRIVSRWKKNRNKLVFYRGILSGFACIHASDEAKNKMDHAAKKHIRNVMANLAETRPEVLGYPIEEIAASRWMSGSYDNFIVQCELFHHSNKAVLYSCLARDGTGPLKTPFLTALLLEDTFAFVQTPFGIFSGAATVTLFKFVDLTNTTAARMALIIANFTNLNAVIFGDYLDHALPDAFYQHIDVV